jgi:hypothetical protein
VKVDITPGDQMNIADTAVIGVRPTPQIMASHPAPDHQRAVFEWASANTAARVAYWEGRVDAIEPGRLLKRVPSRQSGGSPAP